MARRTRLTPPPRTEVEPAPVEHIKVDPVVWQQALELAGGDVKRIQVRSASEVVVR